MFEFRHENAALVESSTRLCLLKVYNEVDSLIFKVLLDRLAVVKSTIVTCGPRFLFSALKLDKV